MRLWVPCPAYEPTVDVSRGADSETTIGRITLTAGQRLLILAIAEPWLRRAGAGPVDIIPYTDGFLYCINFGSCNIRWKVVFRLESANTASLRDTL